MSYADGDPGVYQLTNTRLGFYYIGSSNAMKSRVSVHKSQLRSGTHRNKKLMSSFTDWDDMRVEFIACNSLEEAKNLEQRLLDENVGLPFCCNVGNSSVTCWNEGTMPEEYRQANSERKRGNTNMLGKSQSDETKKKIGDANRGRLVGHTRAPITEETRERHRIANSRPRAKGRQFSDSHRVALSEASRERGLANSRKVRINDKVYPNAGYAATELGVTRRTIILRIESTTDRFSGYSYI